ncbi:MAG TPA: sensor histidine kinase [Verrucomicrobiae bacterium]
MLLDILQCLALLGVTGYLDYATGYNKSFFLFYLAPIVFTLQRLGLKSAVGMCVLSAAVWLVSNVIAGQIFHGWLTPLWNTMIRLAVFLLVVGLFAVRWKLEKQVRQSTDALTEESRKRRRLEQEVLEASERVQRKIGQDLHDSLCQHLTATALAGKVLAKKLAGQSLPETEAASHLVGMVEEGIELTRTLARSLHPIEMQEEGLVDGLREMAANISQGFSVACKLECSQTVSLATADANTHLYRIAQEAISNAIRHGHAKNIAIHLEKVENEIILTVTDDGVGLPSDAWTRNGMGLHIMDYRAGMIGANLQVKRLPTRGTRVTCVLPEPNQAISEAHVEQK